MSRLLRGRVRRLEDRMGVDRADVTAILDAARTAPRDPTAYPMTHWPSRDELERQAAAGGALARLAEARLRLVRMSACA